MSFNKEEDFPKTVQSGIDISLKDIRKAKCHWNHFICLSVDLSV